MSNPTDLKPIFTDFLFKEEELHGVVNSIYGPGILLGWVLSCASLLVSQLLPDGRDAINNDFIVAMTYPAVAATDLIIHQRRYMKQWYIYKGWLGFLVSWKNIEGTSLLGWQRWLSVGFGPVTASRYGQGILFDDVPIFVAAFPYLGHACFQVCEFSLLFCGIFIAWSFILSPTYHKRSLVALVLAYYVSIVSWVHLTFVGRDYENSADLNCLIPSRRFGYCKTVSLGGPTHWVKPYHIVIEFGKINIVTIAILLLASVALWPSRAHTERISASSIGRRAAQILQSFFEGLAFTVKQNPLMIAATLVLAFANLAARLFIRTATVPIAITIMDEPAIRAFPIGVKPLKSPSASLHYTEDIRQTWLPITSYRVTDLDQTLAIVAGALAALLRLKDVLKERGIFASIRNSFVSIKGAKQQYKQYNATMQALELDDMTNRGELPRATHKRPRTQYLAQNF